MWKKIRQQSTACQLYQVPLPMKLLKPVFHKKRIPMPSRHSWHLPGILSLGIAISQYIRQDSGCWADTTRLLLLLLLHLIACGHSSSMKTTLVLLLALAFATIFGECLYHKIASSQLAVAHAIFCPHNSGIHVSHK